MHDQLHVDLETLDTEHTARILSIGAVWHDETFYAEIDTSIYDMFLTPTQMFTYSKATVDWWDRKGGFQPTVDQLETPFAAVGRFIKWVLTVTDVADEWSIWANSPSFDCDILRHHMKVANMGCPWKYWQEEDVRTIKRLATRMRLNVKETKNDHNALRDAINQRDYITNVYDTLADRLQKANEAQHELQL